MAARRAHPLGRAWGGGSRSDGVVMPGEPAAVGRSPGQGFRVESLPDDVALADAGDALEVADAVLAAILDGSLPTTIPKRPEQQDSRDIPRDGRPLLRWKKTKSRPVARGVAARVLSLAGSRGGSPSLMTAYSRLQPYHPAPDHSLTLMSMTSDTSNTRSASPTQAYWSAATTPSISATSS